GGAYDRWEFEVRGGLLGSVRLRAAIEEHGAGRQLVRYRAWPVLSRLWAGSTVLAAALAAAAFLTSSPAAGVVLAAVALALQARALDETSPGMAAVLGAARLSGMDDT